MRPHTEPGDQAGLPWCSMSMGMLGVKSQNPGRAKAGHRSWPLLEGRDQLGRRPGGGSGARFFLARLLCLCGPAFVTNDANRPPLPPFLQNLYYKKRTRQARPVFYPKAHTWLLIFARLATATATATSTAVTGHGRLGHALMSMPAVRKMIPRSRAKTEERHNSKQTED